MRVTICPEVIILTKDYMIVVRIMGKGHIGGCSTVPEIFLIFTTQTY